MLLKVNSYGCAAICDATYLKSFIDDSVLTS